MEESGPHKQSILRNKEVPKKNAPHKPRDVTRPTVMVKRLGFRGTLPVKYKIDFWNNPITASILVWNQVVLNQSQQLGYLSSKLMLSWDCPFKKTGKFGIDSAMFWGYDIYNFEHFYIYNQRKYQNDRYVCLVTAADRVCHLAACLGTNHVGHAGSRTQCVIPALATDAWRTYTNNVTKHYC